MPVAHGRFTLAGRILYLTRDCGLLQDQLAGKSVHVTDAEPLIDNISTDEIAPAWACYYFDETLGRYCLAGLRDKLVAPDAVARGGFEVIVSGMAKGCGSSRETAPFAERSAGIRVVFAKSVEKIYRQNAQNIGLLVSEDWSLLQALTRGESIELAQFTRGLDPISCAIVHAGGLFAYNVKRLGTPSGLRPFGQLFVERSAERGGRVSLAPDGDCAMTIVQKIIARHLVSSDGDAGFEAALIHVQPPQPSQPPKPGDGHFIRADVRFSHDYVTAMAWSLFRSGFGPEGRVAEPESVFAFRDHLNFLHQVMPRQHRDMGLDAQAKKLDEMQSRVAREQGITLFAPRADGAAEGICHNIVLEQIALPGQVIVGSDSHTCTAGAIGCFAFGVGATDLANSWLTRDVRVRVPGTIRIELRGVLGPAICAKDVMLTLLSQPIFRDGRAIGRVLEVGGDGLQQLPIDERATLANMAVEAGAFTAIVEPDERVVEHLVLARGLAPEAARALFVYPDGDAIYEARLVVDLSEIRPMIATPGDPRNGVPLDEWLRERAERARIDIAYGGSCTGGKCADMDMYASVAKLAAEAGIRVSQHVEFWIQFGSRRIGEYVDKMGYRELFEGVGAKLLPPACGACIGAGPGISRHSDEVTISAMSRNFPGRSGPGRVYLAGPYVVAASAFLGEIGTPDDLARRLGAATFDPSIPTQ